MMSENICMYIITLSSFSLLEYFIYTVPYGCKKHPHSYVCMLTFPYTACSASPCTYGIRQASPKPHNTMLPIFRLNTSDQYVPSHIYFFTAFYSCLRFLFFPSLYKWPCHLFVIHETPMCIFFTQYIILCSLLFKPSWLWFYLILTSIMVYNTSIQ